MLNKTWNEFKYTILHIIVYAIKDYINFLDNNTEFTTTYVPVGDKIAISKRKVSNE